MAQFTTYWPMTTAMVFLAVILLGAVSQARLPVRPAAGHRLPAVLGVDQLL